MFAIQCLIFSICSPFRTCEHINIQTYRHLDIYDGGKQPITGEPGPGTGCDGHAVSVRFICWGLQGFNWFNCLAPPFLCERRGMHKIEGWSKVRGGGPKWRIQGLWAILSRSDYKLEPAESWGRLSLNEWSPQGFPPKKNLTLFVPLHLFPKPPKKVSVEKKLSESMPPPFDSKS